MHIQTARQCLLTHEGNCVVWPQTSNVCFLLCVCPLLMGDVNKKRSSTPDVLRSRSRVSSDSSRNDASECFSMVDTLSQQSDQSPMVSNRFTCHHPALHELRHFLDITEQNLSIVCEVFPQFVFPFCVYFKGLVVRVLDYRTEVPARFSEKQWVWNGVHSAS
jgi:hypothetical protein